MGRRTVLLVAAQEREFRGLLRRAGPPEALQWPVDYSVRLRRPAADWFLVANGAGRGRAAEAVRAALVRERFDAVVSTGYCGGLDPALRPGAVVAVTEVRLEGGELAGRAERAPALSGLAAGPLVTLDRVVRAAAEKKRLRERGFLAVDMEAAGVAAELPPGSRFYCIRAVTDAVDETLRIDLNRARDPAGRMGDARVVRAALRRPLTGVPELWRLFRRSRLASERLGAVLFECEF